MRPRSHSARWRALWAAAALAPVAVRAAASFAVRPGMSALPARAAALHAVRVSAPSTAAAAAAMAAADSQLSRRTRAAAAQSRRRGVVAMLADQPEPIDEDELIKRFVLQRSLQTLMFYLQTCRDTPTADWLERFLELPGIGQYHGLDGLAHPWRSYVHRLLEEPPTSITVESVARNRAGSKNNPYMKPKVLRMEFDIVPQRLAMRLLDCAADVAAEASSDLRRMSQENAEIRRAYDAIAAEGEDTRRKALYPTFAHEAEGTDKSAFRGGTYDLLKRLATREGVRRAMRALERDERSAPSRAWLERFFRAHGSGFEGDGKYHVADEFLLEMLVQVPTVSLDGGMVDPCAVATAVLAEREAAAERWAVLLETVPEDHRELRSAFLERGLA